MPAPKIGRGQEMRLDCDLVYLQVPDLRERALVLWLECHQHLQNTHTHTHTHTHTKKTDEYRKRS